MVSGNIDAEPGRQVVRLLGSSEGCLVCSRGISPLAGYQALIFLSRRLTPPALKKASSISNLDPHETHK